MFIHVMNNCEKKRSFVTLASLYIEFILHTLHKVIDKF